MLPCMEWLFGAFHLPRRSWPGEYGTDTKLPRSLAGQLGHPFVPQSEPPSPRLVQATPAKR